MTTPKRSYDSSSRKAAAAVTRQTILRAARTLFLEQGYAGTTMPAVAKASGVALDTVYATVGKKPALFRLMIELALSGTDEVEAGEDRDYVKEILAESDARRKLELYAEALCHLQPRLAPLFAILRSAAVVDEDLKSLWEEIAEGRARNMRRFAANLAVTGQIREELSEERVSDIIWSMNSPEFYILLVHQRGWTPPAFSHWLAEAWKVLLLKP
jgi:AcrR family transcriptional regulator